MRKRARRDSELYVLYSDLKHEEKKDGTKRVKRHAVQHICVNKSQHNMSDKKSIFVSVFERENLFETI